MIYTADHLDDARAVFMFRPEHEPLDYDHRDVGAQQTLLRDAFTGHRHRSRPLADRAGPHARVLLRCHHAAGDDELVARTRDAGRRRRLLPGSAVGGSTSLAVYGAYVLAGELARAGGDHVAAFAAYERIMMPTGAAAAGEFAERRADPIPSSVRGARTHRRRPVDLGAAAGVDPAVTRFNDKGVRLYDSIAGLTTRRGVRLYDTMPVPDRRDAETALRAVILVEFTTLVAVVGGCRARVGQRVRRQEAVAVLGGQLPGPGHEGFLAAYPRAPDSRRCTAPSHRSTAGSRCP